MLYYTNSTIKFSDNLLTLPIICLVKILCIISFQRKTFNFSGIAREVFGNFWLRAVRIQSKIFGFQLLTNFAKKAISSMFDWVLNTPQWILQEQTLHKKWIFPLRISSVNVTKSAGNCRAQNNYCRIPFGLHFTMMPIICFFLLYNMSDVRSVHIGHAVFLSVMFMLL